MKASQAVAAQKRRKAPECENCFKRRIKCDGERPECQKCISKGLKCSGVLNEFDLKFRDQSQIVKKKVQKQSTDAPPAAALRKSRKPLRQDPNAQAKLIPGNSSSTIETGTTSKGMALVRRSPAQQKPSIKYSVNLPPGAFTMGLFLDGHPAMLGSSGAVDPWIAYMKPAIGDSALASPLRLAAEAISLAVFAQGDGRPEASAAALQKYSQCISALRKAIAHPIEAAANDTLTTVLLLTIYEYVTSSDETGKERFFHHTDGVIAVAVYRRKTGSVGYQQMQMFWIVITSIVMRYTYIGRSRSLHNRTTPQVMATPDRKVTIPKQASVRDWLNGLCAAHDDAGGRLFELMLNTLLLRTKSHDLHVVPAPVSLERTEEVRQLFAAAIRTLEKLENWNASLPPASSPTEYNALYHLGQEDVDTAEIWPGNLLTFEDLQAACSYCQWRSLKIMALSVALRNLHWLRMFANANDHEAEFEDLRTLLYEQVDGMCASVPYFIGLKQPLPIDLAYSGLGRAGLDGRGALSIAVMLQFCILVEGIPLVQRQWIKGRLRHLSQNIGVRYANVGYQSDSPCLLFEGDPVLTQTFGGRETKALSTASLSVRSSSSSPQMSMASLSTTTSVSDAPDSPSHTNSDKHEDD